MTRREARLRVEATMAALDRSRTRFETDAAAWRRNLHAHPGRYVLGGFLAGTAIGLLPRRWLTATTAPLATLAFQVARTFVMPMVLGALHSGARAAPPSNG